MSEPNNEQLRPAFNRTDATDALCDQWIALQNLGKGYIQLWEGLDHHFASIGAEDGPDKLQKVVEMAQARNDAGDNIYITPNPMNTRDKRGKGNVAALVETYVDVDCGKLGIEPQTVIDRALSFDIKPSMALMSGNGVQLRYRVRFEGREDWQTVQDGLFTAFEDLGADSSVRTDESRLLKLPGSVASKSGKDAYEPRATEVLHTSDEKITPARMLETFGRKASKASVGIVAKADPTYERQTFTAEDAKRQGRQPTLFNYLSSLRGRGYDLEDAQVLAVSKAAEIGYGDDADHKETPEDMAERVYSTYDPNERTARCVEVVTPAKAQAIAEIDTRAFLGSVEDIWRYKGVKIEELSYSAPRGSLAATFGVLDIGKSTFQRNLAISQAVGRAYFPENIFDGAKAYRVLYVNTEGGLDGLMKKLNLMLNDLDEHEQEIARENFKYIHIRDRRFWLDGDPLDITKDTHAKFFERLISDWGIDAWHIDTFPAMSPFRSEIDPGEWLRKTTTMENIAASTNSVGYFTLHAGKGNGVESEGRSGMDIHKARGTTANLQLAQAAYFLDGDPSGDAPIRLKVVKAKDEKPSVREIKHSSRGWLIDATELDIAQSVETKILARAARSDNAPVRARILAYLKQNPDATPTRAELAEAIGATPDTVTRTVARMMPRIIREDERGRIHRIAETP